MCMTKHGANLVELLLQLMADGRRMPPQGKMRQVLLDGLGLSSIVKRLSDDLFQHIAQESHHH